MMIGFFCGGGGGLVIGGGALLVGGGSVCDDLGGVSTGDEVMLTSHPELAHCAPPSLPLIAAILMQKFPGIVKLTCPENQCHIMRRLENWKHEDLAYQGYTYSLESNQT